MYIEYSRVNPGTSYRIPVNRNFYFICDPCGLKEHTSRHCVTRYRQLLKHPVWSTREPKRLRQNKIRKQIHLTSWIAHSKSISLALLQDCLPSAFKTVSSKHELKRFLMRKKKRETWFDQPRTRHFFFARDRCSKRCHCNSFVINGYWTLSNPVQHVQFVDRMIKRYQSQTKRWLGAMFNVCLS